MEMHSFVLENLEGRALFSVAAPLAASPMAAASAIHQTQAATARNPLTGAFNAHGTYSQPLGNPDVGPQYNFTGGGRKTSLGKFTLAGHVQTPGFINNGRSGGKFTLTTSRGELILILHGPPQPPGSLPPSFSYVIKKGTGAYAGSHGKGRFIVSASDTTHKWVFRFNQST